MEILRNEDFDKLMLEVLYYTAIRTFKLHGDLYYNGNEYCQAVKLVNI